MIDGLPGPDYDRTCPDCGEDGDVTAGFGEFEVVECDECGNKWVNP